MPPVNIIEVASSLSGRDSNDHQILIIPSTYGALGSSLHPGVVAGITLGAVLGFLLLLFAIYSCLGFGPAVMPSSSMIDGSVLSSIRTGDTSSRYEPRRATVRETVEVRTREHVVPGPAASHRPAERVILDPPPPPRTVTASELSDEDEEDEIVVMEEHSPPRRKNRRRSQSRRSSRSRDYYY
jgi:hypothetical protein